MLRVSMLASGWLGRVTLEHVHTLSPLSFVLTDARSSDIVRFCEGRNIAVFVGNPRRGATKEFLKYRRTDVLLSANYVFVVERDVLSHASKYSVNFHGSLLPKYRGRTPHVWAIINNERETGVTAHLMHDECDAGDIVLQRRVPIHSEDTGGSILEKFGRIYPQMASEVLGLIERNAIRPVRQNESHATYFGPRKPADGRIDWSWQRERIRNWIRAQARPYPGAFSFYEGAKIMVHGCWFSDHGYRWDIENGTILDAAPLAIKTSNGALVLQDYEPRDHRFRTGTKFT